MTDIKLAGNYIPLTGELGHLQIVFGSQELEVQAPPTLFLGHWNVKPVSAMTVPNDDFSPVSYSEQTIDFEHDVESEDAWQLLLQVRDNVASIAHALPYDLFFNSNSYVNTLLSAIGISTQTFISYPARVLAYPGVSQDVAQGVWGLKYNIVGTIGNDVLVGGRGNDIFSGGTGVDFLSGGKGNDELYASGLSGENDDDADYLTGGGGRDTFHVGSTSGGVRIASYSSSAQDYVFNEGARGTYDLIRDYSSYDRIIASFDDNKLGLDFQDIDFVYSLVPTGYSLSGREIYETGGNYPYLRAIYDTYMDPNLGKEITALIFYEPESKIPIFAIETSPQIPSLRSASLASAIGGSSGDDTLFGSAGDDLISGGDGDDTLSGGDGNDILHGDAGDDDFYLGINDGSDIYDGGQGTDSLTLELAADATIDLIAGKIVIAGQAVDSFLSVEAIFSGAGNDRFIDADTGRLYSGGDGIDSVEFALSSSAYRIIQSGDGYLVERAYLDHNQSLESRYLRVEGIESAKFAGVDTSFGDALTVALDGTAAADILIGTSKNDMILAGEGNDILYGGAGSDILDGGEGDNNQVRYDGSAADYTFKLNLDGTTTVSSAAYGFDLLANIHTVHFLGDNSTHNLQELVGGGTLPTPTVVGTSGDDNLTGTAGDDIFDSLGGNDYVNGGEGSDTYLYSVNDGDEYIDDEAGSMTDVDVLKMKDINYGDVTFSYDRSTSSNLFLTVNSTGHVITLDEQYYSASEGWGLEKIEFADGISVGLQHTEEGVWSYKGTSGADTIMGAIWGRQDVFEGGKGNDTLIGEAGGDTYIYSKGDGSDLIDDGVGFTVDQGNTDVLRFTDLNQADLAFARDGDHLKISVNETGETITVDWQFHSTDQDWGVEKIEFADGSSWDLQDIWQNVPATQGQQSASMNVAASHATAKRSVSPIPDSDAYSADIIQFPTSAPSNHAGSELSIGFQELQHTASADESANTADIISLEDFLHGMQTDDQATDLWFEPEPIGSVI